MPLLEPCNNNLYAITDCQNFTGTRLFNAVEEIMDSGCQIIQYRNKSNNPVLHAVEAKEIRSICNRYNAKLIINDNIDLAKQVQADGVHLGQADANIRAARDTLGAQAIVGITCHDSLDYAQAALQQGANYVAFGCFFSSKTKPNAILASAHLLQQARTRWPHATLVAIGGITPGTAHTLFSQGADYVAIGYDLFNTHDKAAYLQLFKSKELL